LNPENLFKESLVAVMNYIFFSHVPWSEYPYRHLAEWLRPKGKVFIVAPGVAGAGTGETERLGLSEASKLPPEESVALVSHPFVPTAFPVHRFKTVIALLAEAPPGTSPDLWNKYAKLLSASAGLVMTCSESEYKDLLFKYDSVLLIASADADQQLPAGQAHRDRETFLEALELVVKRQYTGWIMRRQWDEQQNYYRELSREDETNELVWYLRSFYHYMLGEGEEAASCLRRSFAAGILSGARDPLGTRFRFLSAVHALNGEKEQALHTYGITCTTDEERAHYERLLQCFEQGAVLFALGEMLLRIGDLRTASRLLAKSRDDRALAILKSIAVQIGDVRRALSLPAVSANAGRQLILDRSSNERLNGLHHLIQGDRQLAMRCFWRASALNDISPELLELEAIDRALASLSAAEPLPV
jgi:hypothetical protein